MDKLLEKSIVLKGQFEDVVSIDNHYYIIHKLDKICVLPYTIAQNGLLDKIGVIKEIDILEEKENYVLVDGFINQDDPTNLVAANRILFDVIGSNITKADDWMYLGKINNTSISSNMIIYCVNVTDVAFKDSKETKETKKIKKFEMIDSNKVVVSDDALFLAAYLRIFNFFFVQSLK